MAVKLYKPSKSYFTSGEAALLLGCSSFWVNTLIAKGLLDTHRIGDRGWHRIPVKSLQKYARAHHLILDWSLLSQNSTRVLQKSGV